jgi:hypothetical protein
MLMIKEAAEITPPLLGVLVTALVPGMVILREKQDGRVLTR